jgi:hypothetical protein
MADASRPINVVMSVIKLVGMHFKVKMYYNNVRIRKNRENEEKKVLARPKNSI